MQQELSQQYLDRLQELAQTIQDSPEREQYMDTEEEAEYRALCEMFEPQIAALYAEVATNDPLQLITFEQILLNEHFEGLFLPRILCYSVLRGQINDQYRYARPQNHFKNVLVTICESTNFEFIKKRIGQTVQMGFALSSDIWITDLINSFSNRRLRYYLQSNKIDRFRDFPERQAFYDRYKRQFVKDNFYTADFPESFAEMKVTYYELEAFLTYRIANNLSNESLNDYVADFCINKQMVGTDEHVRMLAFAVNFFDLTDYTDDVKTTIAKARVEVPEFTEKYLRTLIQMQRAGVAIDAASELQAMEYIDITGDDHVSEYYRLMKNLHTQGIEEEEIKELVRDFYNNHEGRSTVNEAVRAVVFGYLHRFVVSLTPNRYQAYFDMSKTFTRYMRMFDNQQFNQNLKEDSMAYVRKCLHVFTDKRARDYQDIKKFVASTFTDVKFLQSKEVVEMFKTRRKRKPKDA